ncbi:MAG: hypothetical protein K6F81_00435 [Acholeplasmatales bacterium]|nr:hypothetical protein [Acholeplasmatales bacterium]
MKKRKILLGLALAAAAVFSLSACGEENTPTDSTPAVTPDEGGSGDNVTEKFDVKFMNGATELTALKQTVDKDQKATKPAKANLPTQDGKRFDYWSADGGVTAYNFDEPVTDAVTLTAVFADKDDYDTLAESDKKIFATDFYEETINTIDASEAFKKTSLSYDKSGDGVVAISNDCRLQFKEAGSFFVDFGRKITDTGVFKIRFDITFDALKGESFFQVNGSNDGSTYSRVFELRTDSSKFGYSFDGSNKVASTLAVATVTNYKCEIIVNTSTGKVSASINGTKIADNVTSNIKAVNGLKIQAAATSLKSIDNLVTTFEAMAADPVVTAKAAATKTIDDYLASAAYTDLAATTATADQKAIKALIDKQVTVSKKAINDAADTTAVSAASATWTTFQNADKFVVTVDAYSAANTKVDSVDSYKIAVVANDKINTTNVSFDGYAVKGIYTNAALDASFDANTAITSDTQLYAHVAVATSTELKFSAATDSAISAGNKIVGDSVVELKGVGNSASVIKGKTAAAAQDDSGKSFEYAAILTKTNSDTIYFTLTAQEAVKATVYFTIVDSSFGADNQSASKSGDIMTKRATDAAFATVTTVSGNKAGDKAYSISFNLAANETISLRSSGNRLAIFAIVYEK